MAVSRELSLDDLFSCTICFNEFNETNYLPKLLSCHHTFCRNCLYKLCEEQRILKCPVCLKECAVGKQGIDNLSTNYYLYKFTEVLKNLGIADEDQLLPLKLSQPMVSNSLNEICKKHNTKKYFWCITCKETICIHCLGVTHSNLNGHEVEDLDRIIVKMQRDILKSITAIKGKLCKIDEIEEKVNTERSTLIKASSVLESIFEAPSKCLKDICEKSEIHKEVLIGIHQFCTSQKFQFDVHELMSMKYQLDEVLSYYIKTEKCIQQKYEENESLRESKIFAAIVKPEIRFDYGRIYCIRCGELCINRGPVEIEKETMTGNYCEKCGIVIMEFP